MVRGLPPGQYQVTAVYEGGPVGRTTQIALDKSQSAFLSAAPENVGALEARIPDALCADAQELVLQRVERSAVATTRRTHAVVPLNGQCTLTVAGLPPGSYDVVLAAPSTGLATTESASVSAQRVSTLQFDSTVVRVFGRLTFNHKPPAGPTSLQFFGQGSPTAVTVQADGSFEARLGGPGAYTLRLASGPLLIFGTERRLEAVEGYNRVDWDVAGGSLSVSIRGWDRSSPVDLRLKVTSGPQAGGFAGGRLDPDFALPYNLHGLAFIEYSIEAIQTPASGVPRISRREVVKLDAAHPSATVTLDLEAYVATVMLKNEAGLPVRGAALTSQLEGQAVEAEPGVYRLAADVGRTGDEISIRAAGYVPTCKLAPPNGSTIELTLAVGAATRVRYVGIDAMSGPDGAILWSAADCWVSLRQFVSRPLGGRTEFLLQDFPTRGATLFRLGPASTPSAIDIASDGFLIFRWPSK